MRQIMNNFRTFELLMPHFTRSSAEALRRSLGQRELENGANLKILVFLSKIVTKTY